MLLSAWPCKDNVRKDVELLCRSNASGVASGCVHGGILSDRSGSGMSLWTGNSGTLGVNLLVIKFGRFVICVFRNNDFGVYFF